MSSTTSPAPAFFGLFDAPPNYYPSHDYSPAALAAHRDYYHWLRVPLADLIRLRTLAQHHRQRGGPTPDPIETESILWGFDATIVSTVRDDWFVAC